MANTRDILIPKRILLVEDDILLANMFEKDLSTANFSVTTAYQGSQVVELAEQHLFDLIFLDLLLPGKSGFEILKELKANKKTKDVPVIIITNLGEVEHMERALALGAADYVIKANVSPKEIRGLANKYLLHHTARSHEYQKE
ncbi:response regulator [Candidatus Beckwithbacteria bacterium]|nr:response regulator [Candidatus Beckwithbacteria bacterium]